MDNNSEYYQAQMPALLRAFDRDARLARQVLTAHFGPADLETLIGEARRGYACLIPTVPYIGGEQPFTRFLLSTAELLAVYRVARAHGKSLEVCGVLIYEICQSYLQAYPRFLTRWMGKRNFSPAYLGRLRLRAHRSRQRQYPEGYVFDFVDGDGIQFDFGVDYLECGSCKFLARQGAWELAPYICPADILYSEALGWGLMRTCTLAEGAGRCDFRFKKGGPTKIAVPDALKEVVSRKPR